MKAQENEIILIYNSSKQSDREAMGYTLAVSSHKLNEKDLFRTGFTPRQIAEVADKLEVSIKDLIDTNAEKYLSELQNTDYSEDEILTLMSKNPELIRTPIALMKDDGFVVESPYSLINKGVEISGINSSLGNQSEK